MKKEIHPQYHKDAKVTCACGNTFTIGATQKEVETEICSQCHPFYTGKGKLVDTAGRIEKFKKRVEKQKELQKETGKKKKRTSNQKEEKKIA